MIMVDIDLCAPHAYIGPQDGDGDGDGGIGGKQRRSQRVYVVVGVGPAGDSQSMWKVAEASSTDSHAPEIQDRGLETDWTGQQHRYRFGLDVP